MTRIPQSLAILAAMLSAQNRAQFLGFDIASGADKTGYWPDTEGKPKKSPKDRTKTKAARKQRKGKA